MLRFLTYLLVGFGLAVPALAQVSQLPQLNQSISVTTGLTYQAVASLRQSMRSLTIENNNTNGDSCWVEDSGLVVAGNTTSTSVTPTGLSAITAQKASILLQPGQSYARYYPFIPIGPIVATCTTTADSLFISWQ